MNSKKLIRQKSALKRFTFFSKAAWYRAHPGWMLAGFDSEHEYVIKAYSEYAIRKNVELSALTDATKGAF